MEGVAPAIRKVEASVRMPVSGLDYTLDNDVSGLIDFKIISSSFPYTFISCQTSLCIYRKLTLIH